MSDATTEQQIGAYVFRDGETDMPSGLKDDYRRKYGHFTSTSLEFRNAGDHVQVVLVR